MLSILRNRGFIAMLVFLFLSFVADSMISSSVPLIGEKDYEVFYQRDFSAEGLIDLKNYDGMYEKPEGVYNKMIMDVKVGNTGRKVQERIVVHLPKAPKERRFSYKVKSIDGLKKLQAQPKVSQKRMDAEQLMIIQGLPSNAMVHFEFQDWGTTAQNQRWHDIDVRVDGRGAVVSVDPRTGSGLRTFLVRMSGAFGLIRGFFNK